MNKIILVLSLSYSMFSFGSQSLDCRTILSKSTTLPTILFSNTNQKSFNSPFQLSKTFIQTAYLAQISVPDLINKIQNEFYPAYQAKIKSKELPDLRDTSQKNNPDRSWITVYPERLMWLIHQTLIITHGEYKISQLINQFSTIYKWIIEDNNLRDQIISDPEQRFLESKWKEKVSPEIISMILIDSILNNKTLDKNNVIHDFLAISKQIPQQNSALRINLDKIVLRAKGQITYVEANQLVEKTIKFMNDSQFIVTSDYTSQSAASKIIEIALNLQLTKMNQQNISTLSQLQLQDEVMHIVIDLKSQNLNKKDLPDLLDLYLLKLIFRNQTQTVDLNNVIQLYKQSKNTTNSIAVPPKFKTASLLNINSPIIIDALNYPHDNYEYDLLWTTILNPYANP